MKMQLAYGHKSDLGRQRENMEDAYLIQANLQDANVRQKGALFIVADGVGGNKAGEVASRMAADGLVERFYRSVDPNSSAALTQALIDTNAAIYEESRKSGQDNMATTVVCALVHDHELTVAHIGDSRAYLFHSGRITQLTQDHSWINEQVSKGLMTIEQAQASPYRNVINRSLGNKPEVEPEVHNHGKLAQGDRVLICTDGLYDGVPVEQMQDVLTRLPAQEACEMLVDLANKAGGTDNITVVLIDIISQAGGESGSMPRPAAEEISEHTRVHEGEATKVHHFDEEKTRKRSEEHTVAEPEIKSSSKEQAPLIKIHAVDHPAPQGSTVLRKSAQLEKAIGSEPLPWDVEPTEDERGRLESTFNRSGIVIGPTDLVQWEIPMGYQWLGVQAAFDKRKSLVLPNGREVTVFFKLAENDFLNGFPIRFTVGVEMDGKENPLFLVGNNASAVKELARDLEGSSDYHVLGSIRDLVLIHKDRPHIYVEIQDIQYAVPGKHKINRTMVGILELKILFKIQLQK